MSHGASADGSTCEPNLTPLLDIVLQLLMFFMMCVNFVSQQVTEEIRLPNSVSVKPQEKNDPDSLYVNLKPFHLADFETRLPPDKLEEARQKFQEGDLCVLVPGEPPQRLIDIRVYMKNKFAATEREVGTGNVKTALVIRADKEADYNQVFEIFYTCKTIGYTRMKVQALTKSTPAG